MIPLLTATQVAEIVHRSPKTVRGWIRDELIPHVRIDSGAYLVRPADLEAFINANTFLGDDPLPTDRAAVTSSPNTRQVAAADTERGAA